MTFDELKQIYESVGEITGWDWSRTRTRIAPVPWEYGEVVRRYLRPKSRVIDIGTGGGERFFELASYFGQGVGTDMSTEMISTARDNMPAELAHKVSFEVTPADDLRFPDESFDVVLNRQAPIDPDEIHRVLRPSGVFITQQVSSRNAANIHGVFGVDPDRVFGSSHSEELRGQIQRFERLGCRVEARGEYNVRYWFIDVESLMFWLKAIGVQPELDIERHWRQVNEVIERYGTPEGIETNEHRELLIVRKGERSGL